MSKETRRSQEWPSLHELGARSPRSDQRRGGSAGSKPRQQLLLCSMPWASLLQSFTPLHLFLGISNRIILDAFSELLGKERVQTALTGITTVHSAGCSGKSDLYDLNGPEISKWIKRECSTTLLSAAAAASSTITAATTASHSILSRWLQQLHHCLLRSDTWTAGDIDAWRTAVNDIHSNWSAEAHSKPFPKLHMLHHTIDFAERHRFLGRASEAQIESFHAQFNALFHKQHRNQSGNTAERLRRCLADASLRAVQPCLSSPSSAPSTPF